VLACREAWSAWVSMHALSHFSRPPDEVSFAEALLGSGDPLVSSLRRRAEAVLQLWVATGALACSAAAVVAIGPRALPFVVASAVVALVFGIRVSLRTVARRDAVWDVIISGRGELPLPVVRHECSRLLAPNRRERLAHSYETLGDPPDAAGQVAHRACVIVAPSVVAKVRPELARVAVLLRGDGPSVRGVAAAERLVCDGTSSLYGRDVEVLRQDIHRISYLLGG
jgi:hypothetical protein